MIVALIVGGLAVLANGFTDSGSAAAPSLSPSPTSGGHSSILEPAPNRATLLNVPDARAPNEGRADHGAQRHRRGRRRGGGADDARRRRLQGAGRCRPRRAAVQGVKKTTVYYRDDEDSAQNQSNATYVADKFFKKASVKPLDPNLAGVPASATIVVVVGDDYAQQLVACSARLEELPQLDRELIGIERLLHEPAGARRRCAVASSGIALADRTTTGTEAVRGSFASSARTP